MFRMPSAAMLDPVPDQPATAAGRLRLEHADQQVARDRGDRHHHGVRASLLAVPARHGQHRVQQARGQPSPGRDQAAAGGGDDRSPDGDRDRGRQPQHEGTWPEHMLERPHHQVVGAMHGVDVAEHPDQVTERPADRRDRRRLVPPVRRRADAPQRDQQRCGWRQPASPRRARLVGRRLVPGRARLARLRRRRLGGQDIGVIRAWLPMRPCRHRRQPTVLRPRSRGVMSSTSHPPKAERCECRAPRATDGGQPASQS